MPGLIGFYGRFQNTPSPQFLNNMAQALEQEDIYQVDAYHEADMGLGRVHLGILNPEPQPIWNQAKNLCVVMAGELYDYQAQKQDLIRRGYQFSIDNDAEFMLHLYEEFGDDFAMKLNGAFVAAIWDTRSRTLKIVNDRLGLFPLYYARNRQGLIFSSGVRALLVDSQISRAVNRLAIEEFLVLDHMLHDHTLLEDVHVFPQASILTFHDGQMQIRRYWDMRYPQEYELRREEDLIEELNHLLQQAVARQAAHDDLPTGLLLSGGMDSRALLGLLTAKTTALPGTLETFTWGIPGCDDARYAQKLAKMYGTHHHFFELKPDYMLTTAENAVRLTDGLGNIANLHALAVTDQSAQFAKTIYKGFLGDAMMGFAQRYQHWAMYDAETAVQAHLQVHSDQGVIGYTSAELAQLLSEDFQERVGNGFLESYSAGMAEAQSPMLADQRLYFDLRQRVPRMTINGVEVVRSRTAVRLPFADIDLLNFSINMPPGLRYEQRLMQQTFIKAFPELAKIPMTDTGLPMVSNFQEIFTRGRDLARWHLHKRGLVKKEFREKRPYQDYKNWFRTILRPWVEDTLLTERALQRGYFQPDAVRGLVAEHMTGSDHSVRLGALLTLELWHKQFID